LPLYTCVVPGDTGEHKAVDGGNEKPEKADYVGSEGDESESFSDIDDAEVSSEISSVLSFFTSWLIIAVCDPYPQKKIQK